MVLRFLRAYMEHFGGPYFRLWRDTTDAMRAEEQRAASTAIQCAWRCFAARRTLLPNRSAFAGLFVLQAGVWPPLSEYFVLSAAANAAVLCVYLVSITRTCSAAERPRALGRRLCLVPRHDVTQALVRPLERGHVTAGRSCGVGAGGGRAALADSELWRCACGCRAVGREVDERRRGSGADLAIGRFCVAPWPSFEETPQNLLLFQLPLKTTQKPV